MVKLVYHTAAFGSINLEYEQPVITVGSARDNDLVLAHASVRPHHCQIALREESILICPADGGPAAGSGLGPTDSVEYFVGDKVAIGEVVLEIDHSVNKTVAIPRQALVHPVEPPTDPAGKPFFCEYCRRYYTLEAVTQIGLERRRKHFLCPKCSRPVTPTFQFEEPPRGFLGKVRQGLRGVSRFLERLAR